MPIVTPTGSSPPSVSGSVEDPKKLDRAETLSCSRTFPQDAPAPGLPEQRRVLDCIEVLQLNPSPKQHEKTSGDVERVSGQSKKREEAIKGISISSTAFIGPACRPQPVIEDELSEFYKELAQIDQTDAGDGNCENVSQACTEEGNGESVSQFWVPPHTGGRTSEKVRFWAPSDAINGNSKNLSQSWTRSDTFNRNNQPVSHFFAPLDRQDGNFENVRQLSNPPAIKERGNPHRNAYRPYPAPWPNTADRNAPQWRQNYDLTCNWSNPHSYQNQWQHPPPNFRFHPPPPNPTYPAYSQSHGHQYGQLEDSSFQLGPDPRPASSHSPAPYEAFERRRYEDQDYQDVNRHQRYDSPSLVLILMRGVPGSGKTTLARQISSSGPSGLILSTDDYFYQKDSYHFEPALLSTAHTWNQNRAKKAMLDEYTPVIIDNTNIQAWEMKPYVAAALEMGYRVDFVEPDTSWKCDPAELEKRNHHGVPKKSLINMLDRFELPISVDIVMNSHEPSHKRN
ncbi:NEDD4-binding protein 2-like 2 [Silurus meridionalis]|nr:NEDD4-binding protein 2-like 2 [Silurus meridionalis]KAI5099205.1 NEDD4-binding protein 2 [Silurus meridionalis]